MANETKIGQAASKVVAELKEIMHHDGYDWFWDGVRFRQLTKTDEGELRKHIELWMRDKLIR